MAMAVHNRGMHYSGSVCLSRVSFSTGSLHVPVSPLTLTESSFLTIPQQPLGWMIKNVLTLNGVS
jgi:hypothetical protein